MRSQYSNILTVFGALLIALPVSFGQQQIPGPGDPNAGMMDPQQQQQSAPLLSPDQLNNLVAPVALYPDPLLSQVLSASTYPLELVEAQQWLSQHRNLQGSQLVEAARQQNWDPSVQALVVFPDALNLLANDVRWTTDLGNAFLAQQGDVMSAVQRMRARARANGRLANTPQQVVNVEVQDGEQAIEIMPADPEVVYVPVYNPVYVWGPPAWGYYPDLWYPSGYGFGFGYSPGFRMGLYFSNWGGWGGWGWGCGWFGSHRSLYVNSGFFNRYGYRGGGSFGGRYYGGGGGYYGGRGGGVFAGGGRASWTHDPGHRLGIPYPNRTVASRFSGGGNIERMSGGGRFNNNGGGGRPSGGGWRSFGSSSQSPSGASGFRSNGNRGGFGDSGSFRQPTPNYANGGSQWNGGGRGGYRQAPSTPGDRGWGHAAQPQQHERQQQHFQSAPQTFGGRPSYSAAPAPQQQMQQQHRGGGGGGGGNGGFYSAPRSYAAPSHNNNGGGGGGFSPPQRSYAGPGNFGGGGGGGGSSRSYAAPAPQSHGFSAPRSNGGGGGGGGHPGGGRSGGGGGGGGSNPGHSGHSGGGGGGRGNHK